MELFTITYVSLYGGQLWSETRVYNDREKMKAAYRSYLTDIADNIEDEEGKGKFVTDYIEPQEVCSNVHWESWSGEEMYMLNTEIQIID